MNYSPFDIKLFELFSKKEITRGCIVSWLREIHYVNHELDDAVVVSNEDGTKQWHLDYGETAFTILGHEPNITDVFRVAKEKGWTPQIKYRLVTQVKEGEKVGSYLGYFLWIELNNGERVPPFNTLTKSDYSNMKYDPTLPLLQQEDSTKEELIKLFS